MTDAVWTRGVSSGDLRKFTDGMIPLRLPWLSKNIGHLWILHMSSCKLEY